MVAFINRLEICAARHARFTTFAPSPDAILAAPMPLLELPLQGLAELEVTRELNDGIYLFTSKLTAVLSCAYDNPSEPQILRLTLTDGTQYYIGTNRRPFPTMSLNTSRPAKTPNQSAITLSAQWIGPLPPLRVR